MVKVAISAAAMMAKKTGDSIDSRVSGGSSGGGGGCRSSEIGGNGSHHIPQQDLIISPHCVSCFCL